MSGAVGAPLQLDWYWLVIGMLSAYVLGSLRGYKQTQALAETIVQRTVSSLRPPPRDPPSRDIQRELIELADEAGERDRDTEPPTRRRRNTR